MRQYGLLVPVDVRAFEDGRYALIEGHRRLGAARQSGWASLILSALRRRSLS